MEDLSYLSKKVCWAIGYIYILFRAVGNNEREYLANLEHRDFRSVIWNMPCDSQSKLMDFLFRFLDENFLSIADPSFSACLVRTVESLYIELKALQTDREDDLLFIVSIISRLLRADNEEYAKDGLMTCCMVIKESTEYIDPFPIESFN